MVNSASAFGPDFGRHQQSGSEHELKDSRVLSFWTHPFLDCDVSGGWTPTLLVRIRMTMKLSFCEEALGGFWH